MRDEAAVLSLFRIDDYGESYYTIEISSDMAEAEGLLSESSFIIGLPDSDYQ
ncbi:MAG: hypothetical protein JXA64_10235 [Candidatus Fermentibacteraceae bacterium]|nr:hypothetical protein [Candidatus Fermentibacteraceae bacterium]MBN2609479.1 hypothetical protein [Candidatus Fermentibacteraceae bacterium]